MWAEAKQWLLRRRAAMLLSDLQSIQVGRSTDEDARSILGRSGNLYRNCSENGDSRCASSVTLQFDLPKFLRGQPGQQTKNRLVSLIDDIGLRSSAVEAQVITERGVVVSKSYFAEVDLPVRDWFLRASAFVPSLAVSSDETEKFRDYEQPLATSAHPNRLAHRSKGPYGVVVRFKPQESQTQKKLLMDFKFACITQFFPCSNEDEILAAGSELLEQESHEISGGG